MVLAKDKFDVKKYIHESNLIEDIDDPTEDKQSLVAWHFLEKQDKLTIDIINKVQKIITLHQNDLLPTQRGYTRSMSKVNVYVGNSIPPAWWLVDAILGNWVLDMNEHWQTLDPIAMHIRYERLHCHCDGNGRTGRMLYYWHTLKLGQIPILFLNSEKFDKYYPLFS